MPKLDLEDLTPEMLGLKPWYKSKTMWFNIATVLAGAGPIVANFTGLVSPFAYALLLSVVGGANIALRLMTDKGIE